MAGSGKCGGHVCADFKAWFAFLGSEYALDGGQHRHAGAKCSGNGDGSVVADVVRSQVEVGQDRRELDDNPQDRRPVTTELLCQPKDNYLLHYVGYAARYTRYMLKYGKVKDGRVDRPPVLAAAARDVLHVTQHSPPERESKCSGRNSMCRKPI